MRGLARRDHHTDALTILLGGGVKGGLATPQDLLATLNRALGLPRDAHDENSSGRPVSIVGEGRPIRELAS